MEARIRTNKVFEHLERSDKLITIEEGGARSGKTYNILIWMLKEALVKTGNVFTIVRETGPSIRATAYRDFIEILQSVGIYDERNHNKSFMEFNVNSNLFEFISVDQPQKIRGRKRQYLFINEANELDYETWVQLDMRTEGKRILDYNPSMLEHWIYDKVATREDAELYVTTYLDNPFLPESVISSIERLKELDETNWRIFGLGQRGVHEGIIFGKWKIVDHMPMEFEERRYGLDFGYTNHPTAIVEVRTMGEEIWLDEVIYQTGLSNRDIGSILKQEKIGECLVVADSAEPKSIDEISLAGINITGAIKGADSVRQGVNNMRHRQIYITSRSINLIKEFKSYKWAKRKDGSGKMSDEPVDAFNHGIDAARYAVSSLIFKPDWGISV